MLRGSQSIRPDGIIFSVVKTDFFEIESLIKKLDSGNEEEVKNASYKLRRIFRNNIQELEEEGILKEENSESLLGGESVDTLFNRIIFI
jgi:hypothetical protein